MSAASKFYLAVQVGVYNGDIHLFHRAGGRTSVVASLVDHYRQTNQDCVLDLMAYRMTLQGEVYGIRFSLTDKASAKVTEFTFVIKTMYISGEKHWSND